MDLPTPVTDIYLRPGELYFGDQDDRISTLLGSCVGITVWHPQWRIGGMCHYILPKRSCRHDLQMDGRYAEEAVYLLVREILAAGTRPVEYRARLFGGGDMFHDPNLPLKISSDIPQQNVAIARRLMAQYGFLVELEDMGGFVYRHVIFDLGSGETLVKKNLADALQPAAAGEPP